MEKAKNRIAAAKEQLLEKAHDNPSDPKSFLLVEQAYGLTVALRIIDETEKEGGVE